MVLIKEERLPPTTWQLGRVVEIHPSSDGLVRVVTVRTSTVTIKRSIQKLCIIIIPIEDDIFYLISK